MSEPYEAETNRQIGSSGMSAAEAEIGRLRSQLSTQATKLESAIENAANYEMDLHKAREENKTLTAKLEVAEAEVRAQAEMIEQSSARNTEDLARLFKAESEVRAQAATLVRMRDTLKSVAALWFDASKDDGACYCCDANLHENCYGAHKQLDGRPCPIQLAHDVLAIPPYEAESRYKALEAVYEAAKRVKAHIGPGHRCSSECNVITELRKAVGEASK